MMITNQQRGDPTMGRHETGQEVSTMNSFELFAEQRSQALQHEIESAQLRRAARPEHQAPHTDGGSLPLIRALRVRTGELLIAAGTAIEGPTDASPDGPAAEPIAEPLKRAA